jgi:hypothetical protein
MKENSTLIAALLDRSGSMSFIQKDTEGGFNAFIEDQKELSGSAEVTLSQFDTEYERVYSNVPINDVPRFELKPRGGTALVDGIGRLVTEVGEELAARDESERPETVIVLVMTDGHENSSQEWSADKVKELVKQQTDVYNWKFVFLGANIDAVEVGGQYGFAANNSMTYGANTRGVTATFNTASGLLGAYRGGAGYAEFTDAERTAALGE